MLTRKRQSISLYAHLSSQGNIKKSISPIIKKSVENYNNNDDDTRTIWESMFYLMKFINK